MRVFISADIEGVAGIAHKSETDGSPDYRYFAEQMTREVAAAARAAASRGATRIVVRDGHYTARNILPLELPTDVMLLREWSGSPLSMMTGIDAGFDAALLIGYHSGAGVAGNPLSHTLNGSTVARLEINGAPASEFHVNAYTAASYGVPVVFVSGDLALTETVKAVNPAIRTVATGVGDGPSVMAKHPIRVVNEIESEVLAALTETIPPVELPPSFDCHIHYLHHRLTNRPSFYPGMERLGDTCLRFASDTWFDVLSMLAFCIN